MGFLIGREIFCAIIPEALGDGGMTPKRLATAQYASRYCLRASSAKPKNAKNMKAQKTTSHRLSSMVTNWIVFDRHKIAGNVSIVYQAK